MNDKTMFLFGLGFVLGIALILGIAVPAKRAQDQAMARLEQDIAYYTNTFQTKQGWTAMLKGFTNGINYHLLSVDGGKNWYAVDNATNGFTILDPAETKYPGLVAHLRAMDALTDYVMKNGPIGGSKDQLKMLEDVGFTVVPTQK